MKMNRTLPTIAMLVGLTFIQPLPVRAEDPSDEREPRIENPATSESRDLDESGPVQAVTPPESDEVRITPYRGEEPGYMSGQTRLFGTSGGQ